MNKIKIYSISISMCAVFVSLLINSSYAQSSDDFKTYTNNDLNFTIQHPSDWKVSDDRSSEGIIQFRTPNGGSPVFVVTVHNVTRYLDTDTLTVNNTTPQQYATKELDMLSKTSTLNFKQIRQNEFNFAGNSGWKIEYSLDTTGLDLDLPKNFNAHLGPSYNFDVYTVANGKVYTLKYTEKPLNVPESLPLANKMVESFQFKR